MIFMVCLPSAPRRGVGQQRELARVLHRDRDVALVLDAVAGHPTRADLAAVGDELAEQRGVLVVDTGRLLLAELANLLLRLAHDCLGHCGAPSQVSPAATSAEPEWWAWTGYSVVPTGLLSLAERAPRPAAGAIRRAARPTSRRAWPTGRSPGHRRGHRRAHRPMRLPGHRPERPARTEPAWPTGRCRL